MNEAFDVYLMSVYNCIGINEETDKKLAKQVVGSWLQHLFITGLVERVASAISKGMRGDKDEQ